MSRAIRAYPLEEAPPSFGAWVDSGVPVSVCPAVASALARAFPAIVASALDAVARLAVFWPHPPVAGPAWRVPAPAAVELSADPAVGSREADPALAGASGPTRHSARIAQPVEKDWEFRSDESPTEDRLGWVVAVAKRRSDSPDGPPGGRWEACWTVGCSLHPVCPHSDWGHLAVPAGHCDGLVAEGHSPAQFPVSSPEEACS